MKHYLKMPGLWLVSVLLTLFIDFTLSFSANAVVRFLCAVCTVGIALALMVQGGYSAAKADRKAHIAYTPRRGMLLGGCGAAVPFLLTAMLALAKAGLLPGGFYRLYKLLCAPFLAVCNLLCDDVTAAAFPVWGFVVLFGLSLLPVPAAQTAYRMTMQGKAPEDFLYRK